MRAADLDWNRPGEQAIADYQSGRLAAQLGHRAQGDVGALLPVEAADEQQLVAGLAARPGGEGEVVDGHGRDHAPARQALVVAQLKQQTARENIRVSTDKYKVEAALLSDVLQTQATLADADYEYQKALLAFWTAKAEYEKSISAEK